MKKHLPLLILTLFPLSLVGEECISGDCVNGQGTFTFPDGSKYVGEYKDGKISGQGTFTWADGEQYVGDWKEGLIHGQGTNFFSDGTKIKGEFREDEPWKITVFDKDGNIIKKMLDGVQQKVIYLKQTMERHRI